MKLTHFDDEGHPHMVDISGKAVTYRTAVAEGKVKLSPQVYELVKKGKVSKGDVLPIAEISGINALKKTWELVPLCHSIRLDHASVRCSLDDQSHEVTISCMVKANEITGVEMEALTGVTGAALTIYDMCKGIDKSIVISDIRLVSKSGGKSGTFVNGDRKESC